MKREGQGLSWGHSALQGGPWAQGLEGTREVAVPCPGAGGHPGSGGALPRGWRAPRKWRCPVLCEWEEPTTDSGRGTEGC